MHAQEQKLKELFGASRSSLNGHNYDSALAISERLIAASEKAGSGYYLARGYYHQALASVNIGRDKEAIGFFYKALKLCSDTSDRRMKGNIYNNLGALHFSQKNLATAKACFENEIALNREAGELKPLVTNLINLAAVHRALRESDSSAIALSEARTLLPKLNDVKLNAYFFHGMGVHFHGLYNIDSMPVRLDSAAANYERSLALWMKQGNKEEALRPLFNLGLIYHLKKDFGKALVNYSLAKDITNELNLVSERVTVYGNMAELYYDMNKPKLSAEYFRRYVEMKDSMRQRELNDYALRLDKQFQTAKNRETIRQQELEIAGQAARIGQQGKRIYFALFIIVLVAAIAVSIIVYFNFKKRLDRKIDEAKKKFFSNVVHEIRTPLSMIQAPLRVMKAKLSSPDDLRNIELAERNIQRLGELVNQMLDISKIEATKYHLNETFGDLEIFFSQLIVSYTKLAAEKDISLLHQFNIAHKVAFFDKDALEKIAGNLLSNAIKYTGSGSRIGMDVFTEDTEQGLKLTVSVWDTGVGISEKDRERIFTRFYRAEEVAGSTKGVGIGLSLVKDLVELQKGSIDVKSSAGKGSTFTVTLTLRPREENILKPLSQTADERSGRILIVEDDKDILDFNSAYLESNGFTVIKASDGNEALELLEKTLPDLILTDLMMSGLDGLGLLKAVRGNPAADHIPVIVLSAKAAPESRLETLRAGAQGYLVKPFMPDELLSVVSSQLEILSKKKTEFKEQIRQPEKRAEEKFVGTEPYTQKLFALIFKHLDDPELSVEKLADLMATNRSHFQRKVKAITGLSPSEIIKAIRLEKARELLLARNGNITEVAYQTGFSSQSYFTRCFTQHFGVSPSQMMQGVG